MTGAIENLVYRFLGDYSPFTTATKAVDTALNTTEATATRVGKSIDNAIGPRNVDKLVDALNTSVHHIPPVAKEFEKVGLKVDEVAKKIDEGPTKAVDNVINRTKAWSSTLKSVGVTLTAVFGSMVGLSVYSAGKFEQTFIAFETMLGTKEKTKDMLDMLTEFAALTPFEMPEIEQAARGLLMFGESADSIKTTLQFLGNAASGTSSSFGEIALIYNQIRGVGKLLTQDFRQLSTRGVLSLQDIADHFDVTTEAAQKMLSTGKIGFDDVGAILAGLSAEGGRFANLMEKQSQSFLGLISTFKDAVGIELRVIGQEILPYAKTLLNVGLQLVQTFSSLPSRVKTTVAVLLALGAGVGSVSIALGSAIGMLGIFTTQGLAAKAALSGMTFAFAGSSAGISAWTVAVVAAKVALVGFGAALAFGAGYLAFYQLTMGAVNEEVSRAANAQSKLAASMSLGTKKMIAEINASETPDKAIRKINEELEIAQREMDGATRQVALAQSNLSKALAMPEDRMGQRKFQVAITSQEAKDAASRIDSVIERIKALQTAKEQFNMNPLKTPLDEKTLKSTQDYIDSLKVQVNTLGMSKDAAKRYELSLKGVDGIMLRQIKTLQDRIKAFDDNEKKQNKFKESQEALQDSFKQFVTGLDRSAKTFGKSSEEVQLYTLIQRDLEDGVRNLTAAQIGQARVMIRANLARREADKLDKEAKESAKQKQQQLKDEADALKESLKSPYVKAIEQIARYKEMLDKGLISQKQYIMALEEVRDGFDQAKSARDAFDEATEGRKFDITQVGLRFGAEGDTFSNESGRSSTMKDKGDRTKDEAHKRLLLKGIENLIKATKENKPAKNVPVDVGGAVNKP